MHAQPLCVFLAVAASFGGDIIPPGYRPMRHELVLEADPALLEGRKLLRSPTGGFHGIEPVVPGTPFEFSSKYGTALYLAPGDYEPPPKARSDALKTEPGVLRIPIPVAEVAHVPVSDRSARVLTRVRLVAAGEGTFRLDVLDETRFDAAGAVLGAGLAALGVAPTFAQRLAADGRLLTVLTIVLEVAIVLLLAPADRRRRAALVAAVANLVTHPIALAAVATLSGGWAAWGAVEAAVTLVELLAYRAFGRLTWSRAALCAVVANAATAGLGAALG
jgi:hypothetical protein